MIPGSQALETVSVEYQRLRPVRPQQTEKSGEVDSFPLLLDLTPRFRREIPRMSKQQYLSDDDMHWHPHVMWYVPGDSAESWEANLPGVPAMAGNVPDDRVTVFLP